MIYHNYFKHTLASIGVGSVQRSATDCSTSDKSTSTGLQIHN